MAGYMSERMDRKKEERRNRILDVAERIIAIKGVRGTTMDDVAREADVATGTVYLYFKNKNSLCAAVSARLSKEVFDNIKARTSSYKSGSDRVRVSSLAIIEFLTRHPDKWKSIQELAFIDLSNNEDENVQEFLSNENETVQYMAGCYREAINEGTMRPDIDPVPAAIFNNLALMVSFDPMPKTKAMLRKNGVSRDRWLAVSWDLVIRSTHQALPHKRESFAAELKEACDLELATLWPGDIYARIHSKDTLNELGLNS